ncbi:MAG: acetyl-CoA carboxylase biotin carboxyl carrier protein subunit [Candidatus Bathyarchaeota archaeon]|nr:MAG: acetyl-CoA carboxylase biotin carboxyl carrier protein subunit [Candidatus Bathyarchaeota archaeon]
MTTHDVLVNKKTHRVKVLERRKDAFLFAVNEKTVKVKIRKESRGKAIAVEISKRFFRAKIKRIQGNILHVKIGERIFEVQRQPKTPKVIAPMLDQTAAITRRPALNLTAEKDAVTAPIAGRIELLKADVGQKVGKGECICVLEAMKMENEIAAPKAGVVKEIRVSKGAVVNKGDVLAVIT